MERKSKRCLRAKKRARLNGKRRWMSKKNLTPSRLACPLECLKGPEINSGDAVRCERLIRRRIFQLFIVILCGFVNLSNHSVDKP